MFATADVRVSATKKDASYGFENIFRSEPFSRSHPHAPAHQAIQNVGLTRCWNALFTLVVDSYYDNVLQRKQIFSQLKVFYILRNMGVKKR